MAKRKAAAPRRKAARKPTRKAVRKASKRGETHGAQGRPGRSTCAATCGQTPPRRKAARVVKATAPKARPKSSAPSGRSPALPSGRSPPHYRANAGNCGKRIWCRRPPSTLGFSPKASSAETGQNHYNQRKREHTEGGPALTGGDLDADWNEAYSSGEETPGGDMPTPDQDVVEEIGRALGVEYEDAEELKGADKIEDRDRHRWEYDPASAEDYRDRNRRDDD